MKVKVPALNLDILGKLTDDITSWGIFANVIFRFSERRVKDTIAGLDSTTNLGCGFPDDLREMRKLWVGRVVLRDFIRPRFDGCLNAV